MIIDVTETKIREAHSINLMPELTGYCFEFVPTPLSGGGVGLFIDENGKYRIVLTSKQNQSKRLFKL